MKEVITRITARWEGSTLCEDEVVTDEKLISEQNSLKQYIIESLGLDDDCIKNVNIQVTFEVRECNCESETKIK